VLLCRHAGAFWPYVFQRDAKLRTLQLNHRCVLHGENIQVPYEVEMTGILVIFGLDGRRGLDPRHGRFDGHPDPHGLQCVAGLSRCGATIRVHAYDSIYELALKRGGAHGGMEGFLCGGRGGRGEGRSWEEGDGGRAPEFQTRWMGEAASFRQLRRWGRPSFFSILGPAPPPPPPSPPRSLPVRLRETLAMRRRAPRMERRRKVLRPASRLGQPGGEGRWAVFVLGAPVRTRSPPQSKVGEGGGTGSARRCALRDFTFG